MTLSAGSGVASAQPPQSRSTADAGRRLSVCYVAPGQDLMGTAGPTRNVLNLATALSSHADVTVAFRHVADGEGPASIGVLEIDGGPRLSGRTISDDSAIRGMGVLEFMRYQRTVRRFVAEHLRRFDLVFEKSWMLSGFVAAECRKLGVPALVIENLVPVLDRNKRGLTGLFKRVKVLTGRALAGRYLRAAQCVIAETDELKSAMVSHWQIPAERIAVVTLGVDRKLFRPLEQSSMRAKLGLAQQNTLLLYSGVIDATHNLRPVIKALGVVKRPDVELHIIGDGGLRAELEQSAQSAGAQVFFHGRVPHVAVPEFIAAADLCLAPYEPSAFPGGKVAYSSLKIPEYMSVGRAVASVPSGRVLELISHGINGFLFANTEAEWTEFLRALPDRGRLASIGRTALESRFDSWDDVAMAYMSVGKAEISRLNTAAR